MKQEQGKKNSNLKQIKLKHFMERYIITYLANYYDYYKLKQNLSHYHHKKITREIKKKKKDRFSPARST